MPLITLITDLGKSSYLLGAIKGQFYKHIQNIQLVDITHDVEPYNLFQGVINGKLALKHFPTNVFHVLLIGAQTTTQEYVLMAESNGSYLFAPDNGTLPLVVNEYDSFYKIKMQSQTDNSFAINFVQTIAQSIFLIANNEPIENFCELSNNYLSKTPLLPSITPDHIEGQVIFVDTFGNVIVNITKDEFESSSKNKNFRIEFAYKKHITVVSKHYSDVRPGDMLCLFNTANYLEISINQGNASQLLGLDIPARGHNLIYNSIKIHFEPR